MKLLPYLLASLLLCACNKPQTPAALPIEPSKITYDVPEIELGTATGTKLDPATVSPDNNGMVLDVNNDGVNDFIQLRGHELFFRNKTTEPEVKILTIRANVVAYCVLKLEDHAFASILFWTDTQDGYVQNCIGVNEVGIPYFGGAERQ